MSEDGLVITVFGKWWMINLMYHWIKDTEIVFLKASHVCLFIVVFFISTVGYYFNTCHTSMMVNGLNWAKTNGAKMNKQYFFHFFFNILVLSLQPFAHLHHHRYTFSPLCKCLTNRDHRLTLSISSPFYILCKNKPKHTCLKSQKNNNAAANERER